MGGGGAISAPSYLFLFREIMIKVLIANDAHYLGTGYGVYGKELLSRLHNSGKYEVAEIGCYSDGSNPQAKQSKWRFYPAIPREEEDKQKYKSNVINQFGAFVFSSVLLDFKPDIVFDVRDYWMYSYQETHPYRPFYKWVVMPTVDSAPQKNDWLYTFSNMDMIVPYTKWAKDTLLNQCASSINLFPKIANAGINPQEFYPISNKKAHQKSVFGKPVRITGLVMRNQKRKLFPDIFKAYRQFLNRLLVEDKQKEYDKHYLYVHTSYPEQNGWDLPQLLIENELLDKVYFTYTCQNCKKVYPSKFNNSVAKCRHCGENSLIMPNASNPVDTKELNNIYNLFDFFIQYAICEGFGMPQVEAASCGIPIASVDYSAMTEIVDNLNGYKIPVERTFRELETAADRAYPDINATIDILYNFYYVKSQAERNKMSENTRKLCSKHYTWDGVYDVWDECFSSIDLSDKLSWSTDRRTTNHENTSVPPNLERYDFVKYIINDILKEPYLLNTAPIQTLIKNFTSGMFADAGAVKTYRYQDIAKILENYLNNKVMHENMRMACLKK